MADRPPFGFGPPGRPGDDDPHLEPARLRVAVAREAGIGPHQAAVVECAPVVGVQLDDRCEIGLCAFEIFEVEFAQGQRGDGLFVAAVQLD